MIITSRISLHGGPRGSGGSGSARGSTSPRHYCGGNSYRADQAHPSSIPLIQWLFSLPFQSKQGVGGVLQGLTLLVAIANPRYFEKPFQNDVLGSQYLFFEFLLV